MNYQALPDEKPKRARDWTPVWDQLQPIGNVNGAIREALDDFCARKRITFAALEALDARYAARHRHVCLAFAGRNRDGTRVLAIKYRPVDGSSHDSEAEQPSVWLLPIMAGKLSAVDWFVAEGETDGARLYDLVGDAAAILVLPAGAKAFKPEWAALIPRDANVYLCHDADEDGDQGAEKAARIIGGKTVRVRPPLEGGDWCDWQGTRAEFVELVNSQRAPRYEFAPLADFLAHPFPKAEPLLGEPGAIILARGSLLMVYGADGCGKSTWTIDGIAHLAAGKDWLGFPVPRKVRVCIIENEGPPDLFQQKLKAKIASWDGPDFTHNLYAFKGPWGDFSFADPDARAALNAFCDDHAIDVVTANPTLGLGVAASGRPDETQAFVDWLGECGLKSERAFWLLHHENKAGQISGDWGRHPDTKAQLQQDGNRPRTKLDWAKTRWATLSTNEKAVLLDWVVETQSYTVTELDTIGASDSELLERLVDYVTKNPGATTNTIQMNVKGTNSRIRALLDGEQFDCFEGKRGAHLWFPRSTTTASGNDEPTRWGANPHE
jgi:AAA domain